MADMTSGTMPALGNVLKTLGDMGLSDLSAKAAVTREMIGQAYLLASVDMFTVSAWLCLVAIVLVWLCRRCAPHGMPPLTD
jgi:DHA2 family multidrug resistance protein